MLMVAGTRGFLSGLLQSNGSQPVGHDPCGGQMILSKESPKTVYSLIHNRIEIMVMK